MRSGSPVRCPGDVVATPRTVVRSHAHAHAPPRQNHKTEVRATDDLRPSRHLKKSPRLDRADAGTPQLIEGSHVVHEKNNVFVAVSALCLEVKMSNVNRPKASRDSKETLCDVRAAANHDLSDTTHKRKPSISLADDRETTSKGSLRYLSGSKLAYMTQRNQQDAIDLYRESCQIFQSFSAPNSSRNSCSTLGLYPYTTDTSPRQPLHQNRSQPSSIRSWPCDNKSTRFPRGSNLINQPLKIPPFSPEEDEELLTEEINHNVKEPPPATILTWTSDESRKAEYERIDRSHSGLRGLWKRVTPKCCHSQRSRRAFYTGKCDGDSVRRFRVDVPDEREKRKDTPWRTKLRQRARSCTCV